MNDKGKYWDEAWNTVIGCSKCSPGCGNCWAASLHWQRHKAYREGKKVPKQYAKPFGEIQLLSDRLDKPLHWRNPRTIFVNNMGDTFHPAVPFEFVGKIFGTTVAADWHKYLFLTKRPERLLEFAEWFNKKTGLRLSSFKHIWLGTTICNQAEADKNIPILLQIPAAKRWLSIEPLLGPIDLKLFKGHTIKTTRLENGKPCYRNLDTGARLSWVVVGCESGPNRRPCKIEWIESIVNQCQAAGVPVFVKQISQRGKVVKDINKFPKQLQVRDEL